LLGRYIERLGEQQPLGLERAFREPRAELFINDPFMQGMLVDDDDTVLRLRDQIQIV